MTGYHLDKDHQTVPASLCEQPDELQLCVVKVVRQVRTVGDHLVVLHGMILVVSKMYLRYPSI